MTRRLTVATCLLLLLTACRAVAPGAQDSAASGLAIPPVASPSAIPSSPSTDACPLGVGVAEYVYGGLREFVGEFRGMSRGIAIAEVVSVGPLQYSTESGERPSCEEIEDAGAGFVIGRIVEVRVITPAGGSVRKGEVLSFLFQGGSLNGDRSPGHPFGLGVPSEGDRMLVLIAKAPVDADPGPGELPFDVLEMFLVTPEGRIVTPEGTERVTVDGVADLLRDVVPSPAPGG